MTMTQQKIEQLNAEEYSSLLAFGDPVSMNAYQFDEEDELQWISTLDSTTYPGMTFGYTATLY